MSTSTALAPKEKQATLKDLLDRATPSLKQVLPKHLTAERIVKIALAATARDSKLLQCSPQSILGAVMQASQLGLEPNSVLGGAYLVPYGTQAQLIVGYRGLIDLARRSGQIQSIEARVVHDNEKFRIVYGLNTILEHEPVLDAEPGKMVAVYAIARLKDGATQVEVMTRAQVEAIRTRSRAGGSGPWQTDYEEMARKTVVRRLCKYLPLSVELATAIDLDDRAESGEAVAYSEVIDIAPDSVTEMGDAQKSQPPKTADDLIARAKAKKAAKSNGTETVCDACGTTGSHVPGCPNSPEPPTVET